MLTKASTILNLLVPGGMSQIELSNSLLISYS